MMSDGLSSTFQNLIGEQSEIGVESGMENGGESPIKDFGFKFMTAVKDQ